MTAFLVLMYCAQIMATGIDDRPTRTGDTVDLDAALNEVAGHLNAQHARLVDLTTELLHDEQRWIEEGLHTVELFLQWRIGLAPQRARLIAAIARRAGELPDCMTSFRNGELSVDQMTAITARAPWWTDHEICDLAKLLTLGQLRRTLAQYPFPDIPSPTNPPNGTRTPHRRHVEPRTLRRRQRRRRCRQQRR